MGATSCGNNQVTAKSMHFVTSLPTQYANGTKSTGTSGMGVVTGFCDGHVDFITNSVTQAVWFMLHSRNDGQVVPGYDN
jgi:hypothetical protein